MAQAPECESDTGLAVFLRGGTDKLGGEAIKTQQSNQPLNSNF